ncbi:DegT/DnrJ/EryC1/StrS family aminotransferase [bacterium]|nr:DegT/DnrJ/EryC1/StrS family aminotransferase [bacterium]
MSKLAINGGEPVRTEPFPKWPIWDQQEIDAVTEVVKSSKWGSLHGDKTKQFEQMYAEAHNAKHGIAVGSGTAALRIALMAAGIGPGDEVIVPSYTFIASASAIVEANAIPVFAEIEPDTFNLDPNDIEARITPRTKAIMPVHFGGRMSDMDAIMAIAEKHQLIVIEDAAQAWGSAWKGQGAGSIGAVGCFSFQSSKNVTAGEGGMILTNSDEIANMVRAHYNCGRSDDGEWYEHFYFGSNLRMTEFQSAILQVQFKRYPKLLELRQKNAAHLYEQLTGIKGVNLMKKDDRITSNSTHIFIWRYDQTAFNNIPKDKFIEAMRAEGIQISPGYTLPVHMQPVFRKSAFGPAGRVIDLGIDYSKVSLPLSEKICADEAIWFNQNQFLGTEKDMDDIATAIRKIQANATEI